MCAAVPRPACIVADELPRGSWRCAAALALLSSVCPAGLGSLSGSASKQGTLGSQMSLASVAREGSGSPLARQGSEAAGELAQQRHGFLRMRA